jgi:hypothetical protein
MAHDVFVSYASGDKPVADAVCGKLEASGIRCWMAPRDVLPGVHYGEAIIDAINDCRIMVLVFSSKANLSGHIPKEIERAVSKGVTVMPLRIEDVAPAKSLDYFIGSVHWLDALTPPLEAHLRTLAANVQTLLSRSAHAAEAHAQATAKSPIAPPLHAAPAEIDGAHRAAKPAWTYAVIGVLVVVILVLGFEVYWFQSRNRSSTPKTAAIASTTQQTAALASAAPAAAAPALTKKEIAAATPAAGKAVAAPPKKNSAAASQPPKPAQPSQPLSATAIPPASHAREVVLRHVLGSTVKLEQLIGDEDKERHQPTRNQTLSRYGLQGADLGYSFEHQGLAYFLFGSTVGTASRLRGTIATSNARDPESGVPLEFLTNNKQYVDIVIDDPRRANAGMFQVPVSGISLGGQVYVVVRRIHPLDRTKDRSFLTKFIAPGTFQQLRTVSALPEGRFIKMSMHAQPGPIAGLPDGGPFVVMWGTGTYRQSDAYLSIVPAADFETGKGTRYFSGLDAAGAPMWSEKEGDSTPVVKDGTLGDLSVTWCKELGLWLMTYDSRNQRAGIVFSYSRTPWGPWSEPQVVFNMVRDGGLGKFIHKADAVQDDGLAGPILGAKKQANPGAIRGAAYAPYVVERWTKVDGPHLTLYYVMSTLNPYVVVLMKSRLDIE